MGLVAVLAAALLVSLATVINTAPGQSLRTSYSVCSTVKFVPGDQEHQVAEKILKELCETGLHHVVQAQRRPRGGEQFAIVNLHRDAFSEKVNWQEGDAKSVVDDSDWRVDEEEALVAGKGRNAATPKTFYHWYLHGLPMWPLLNQTLKKTKNFFPSLSTVKWPNYALATPLYLVPYERRNRRNEIISINKMFQKMESKKHKAFKDTVRFKKYVTEFCHKACDSIERDPDRLDNWLVPLIDHSLTHMMASFKNQQSKCPDQLYVFFLLEPCRHDSLLLKEKIDDLLHGERCLDITRLVIGYSAKVTPSAC